MAPSCWFFWAWWLPLTVAVVAAEEKGEGCSAKKICGNITISDPFWLTHWETGRSCGPLNCEVHCSNNTPILRSSGFYGFAILGITYEEGSLRVVDTGKLKFLDDSGSCQAPTWNTSDKLSSPFRISPQNMDLVLYNCTEAAAAAARRDRALVETRMRCGNKSEVFARTSGSYAETGDYAGYAVEDCDAIVVPVLGGAAKGVANASDYEQLIRDGFLLTWESPSPLPAAHKFAHPGPSNHL